MFVQRTAAGLVQALENGDLGESARTAFNDTVNAQFEGTRDYIVTHYKTNSRTDTDYWRANAANTHLSEPLKQLLNAWISTRPLIGGLQSGAIGRGYPVVSWYSLLAGMGIFPEDGQLRPPTALEAQHDLAAIDNLLDRSARNFPDHLACLRDIPAKVAERSLQMYLW